VTDENLTGIPMHVGDIDRSSNTNGTKGEKWNAEVTVSVHEADEALLDVS
jgi:hypothetical protein